MGSIQAIDKASVHRITSGQVVVDLQTAVKELVENSIDAGATSIEVRFKDSGLSSVEVIDNGSGISPNDYYSVALKHHTSKLSAFEDLTTIDTFGFRGEALASICALSESVTITTATSSEAPMGTVIELERSGAVKSSNRKVARQRGTTIVLTGLFQPLTVRRKELTRNISREYGKTLALLNAYALYPCATENGGIRLTVSNQSGTKKRVVQLQTTSSSQLTSGISSVWGPKALVDIIPLELDLKLKPEKNFLRLKPDAEPMNIQVSGLISKFAPGCGRGASDRQFFYVNGRPFNASKVQKIINEVYRTFNMNQYPFVIANFVLPKDSYDVNVSPDKRTVMLHNEAHLIASLKIALEETFASARSTYTVMGRSQSTSVDDAPRVSPALDNSSDGELDPELSMSSVSVAATYSSGAPSLSRHRRTSSSTSASTSVGQDASPLTKGSKLHASSALSARSSVSQKSVSTSGRTPAAAIEVPENDDDEESEDEVVSLQTTSLQTPGSSDVPKRKRASLTKPGDSDIPALMPPRSTQPTRGGDGALVAPPKLLSSFALSHGSGAARSRSAVSSMSMSLPSTSTLTGLRRKSADVGSLERTGAQLTLRESLSGFARRGATVKKMDVDQKENDEDEDDGAAMDVDKDEDSEEDQIPVVRPKGKGKEKEKLLRDGIDSEHLDDTDDAPEAPVPGGPENDDAPPLSQVEVLRHNARDTGPDVILRFDMIRMSSSWTARETNPPLVIHPPVNASSALAGADVVPSSATEDAEAVAPETVLSRVIAKDDFLEGGMSPIGQFNLGFIIARLRKKRNEEDIMDDDLFIIDQHASDEKYNFETLQMTTKIQSQRLLRPRSLEFTATDELTAVENLDILKANGFEISFDEAASVGSRLHLVAQPESKSTVFDMKDLEELLSLMQDQSPGQMVRCSKARAMFASRACRKSIMIGKDLTRGQMTSVIRHMATLDQPWNCPHGRPTMRHLVNLGEYDLKAEKAQKSVDKRRGIDWTAFFA